MNTSILQLTQKKNAASLIALGGILTGITVLLTTLGNILSLVDILQYLALTPIILAGLVRGPAFSIQVALASTLLIGLIWGFFPGALFFFITIVPLGVAIGFFLRREFKTRVIILCTIIMLSLSLSLVIFLSIKLFGVDFERDLRSMAETVHLSSSSAMRFCILLSPTFVFFMALCYSFYIWIFNAYLLHKIGLYRQELTYFLDIIEFFNLPEYMVIIFLSGIGIHLAHPLIRSDVLEFIALNVICITSVLFYFRGVFLTNIVLRRRMGKVTSLLIYVFAISIGIPLMVLGGMVSITFKRKIGY